MMPATPTFTLIRRTGNVTEKTNLALNDEGFEELAALLHEKNMFAHTARHKKGDALKPEPDEHHFPNMPVFHIMRVNNGAVSKADVYMGHPAYEDLSVLANQLILQPVAKEEVKRSAVESEASKRLRLDINGLTDSAALFERVEKFCAELQTTYVGQRTEHTPAGKRFRPTELAPAHRQDGNKQNDPSAGILDVQNTLRIARQYFENLNATVRELAADVPYRLHAPKTKAPLVAQILQAAFDAVLNGDTHTTGKAFQDEARQLQTMLKEKHYPRNLAKLEQNLTAWHGEWKERNPESDIDPNDKRWARPEPTKYRQFSII